MRFREIRNEERGEERLLSRQNVEEIEKQFSPESFRGVGVSHYSAPNTNNFSKREEEIEKEFSPESFRM